MKQRKNIWRNTLLRLKFRRQNKKVPGYISIYVDLYQRRKILPFNSFFLAFTSPLSTSKMNVPKSQSLTLPREEKACGTLLQKSMVITHYAFLMLRPSPASSHVPSCPRDEYICRYACISGFTVTEKRKELITSWISTSCKCCKAEGTVFWNQIFRFEIELYLVTDPKCYFILLNSVILNININDILNL